MIHGVLLRWVVTGLFALGAVECALPILTQRRPARVVVSHGLHVAMAGAMAAMAWPWSMRYPTTPLAVFFLLAAVWFATLVLVADPAPAPRRLSGYHALMMLATAWMYVTMNGGSARITAVNWLGALIFTAATLFWMLRYLTDAGAVRVRSLGNLAQAAMAAGMDILFLATLFCI
ncbi:DUF5134 domain-containing protein [Mycobacterium sp. Lab-001]|uniref:DUF5134 domain-containing protein n=1 Tax=Mycobacterium sp. Lab-001 TaxID=3410136 RepID=UPI003D1777DD